MKPGTTIILGGPKHGTRISAPGAHEVCVPDVMDWRRIYSIAKGWPEYGIGPDLATVRYQVVHVPLGPVHRISAALHPDISHDTGTRLLADLVVSCWERHGRDTG